MRQLIIINFLIFLGLLSSRNAFAQNQLYANQKDISSNEMRQRLLNLFEANDQDSLALFMSETKALENSSREELQAVALIAYRILNNTTKVDSLNNLYIKRNPRGVFAASREFDEIFEQNDLDPKMAENAYFHFLKKFDINGFPPFFQPRFHEGAILIINKYLEDGQTENAMALANSQKNNKFFPLAVGMIYESDADSNKYKRLLPLLEEAYIKAQKDVKIKDEVVNLQSREQQLVRISSFLAESLFAARSFNRSIALSADLLTKSQYQGETSLRDTRTLSRSLAAKGEKDAALESYQAFLKTNGDQDSIAQEAKILYNELYPDGNFEQDLSLIQEKVDHTLIGKLRKKIVKKEAPGFTLVNREGHEVSLTDYKGKVVVLDFWATWCWPCIASFPGMQAAINKFSADPEVEFLFIDTWEQRDNYKQLVDDFLTKNKYNFHVLFDEMDDPSKAIATAYGVEGIPQTIVIDKSGYIRFTNTESETNVSEIVKELESMITLAKSES